MSAKKAERFTLVEFENPRSATKSWRVTGRWPDGKRERSNFQSKVDAIEHKAKVEQEAEGKKEDVQLVRTSLTHEQLIDAENAIKLAGGDSVAAIVTQQKLLQESVREHADLSLDQAIAFFRNHYKPQIEELPVYIARERFITSRRELRPKTLAHYKNTTNLLIKKDPNKPVHKFTVGDIQKLLSPYKNPNSHLTFRRGLSIFFNWAVRYHHSLENPCLRLDKAPKVSTNIVILSLDEVKRLLKAATLLHDGAMVPSLVLLLFTGLRPSELEDLTIKDVKKDRIRVSGGKLRRQLNRSVSIPPILQQWLDAYPFKGRPNGWVYKMRKLKAATKAQCWVSDVLRHTSISFQLERDQDEGKVAFNNGTSSQMINQHYRDTIDDEEEVAAFWDLTPAKISNVELPEDIKQQDFKEWPTDAKLKKLVWAKPLSRLALDLDVSDSAIRKRCKQHGIELPKNGHWQREFQREKSSL